MNELIGFIGIAVLITIQISLFAYGYGKLNQKVTNIEMWLNDLSHDFRKLESRVGKLEAKS